MYVCVHVLFYYNFKGFRFRDETGFNRLGVMKIYEMNLKICLSELGLFIDDIPVSDNIGAN